jgi:hypothetical protein
MRRHSRRRCPCQRRPATGTCRRKPHRLTSCMARG